MQQNGLPHFDLLKGGTLNIEMGATPNKQRGIRGADAPYSLSKKLRHFKPGVRLINAI